MGKKGSKQRKSTGEQPVNEENTERGSEGRAAVH